MGFIEDLKWRHACKGMNGEKVSQEKIDTILESINLAPTSLGLQAYKVFVIENQELKNKIMAEACPQQPVAACSHLLVFAAYTRVNESDLDKYFALIKNIRNPSDEWLANYRKRIESFIEKNQTSMENWLARQTYIALGVACAAAANERVDSVPIEGYDKVILDRILNLSEQNLASNFMLPLGYKDIEKDWMSNQAKVRKDIDDLVEVIK